ncbi:MAG: N-6 DNA methylase, partial [Chloroflexi bacterium]|nr:N-6 DNA methylase [Chloroflexota bacterium]
HADFASILSDFGKRTRTEDPVVHFYETFLSVYDPKLRASRGVYYTPEPVVQFIVHSVDWILKNRFGRTWGLADQNVKILDPATGTATFLYYVIQSIHEEVTRRGQAGAWPAKSKELLRRVFGFELLMAPYVVSHLKLGLLMQGLGAPLSPNERLQVYLTNTLEEGTTRAETIEGLGYYIAEEASQAARVKKQEDIMVVLGNPPYSANSANLGKWISDQIRENYYPRDEIKEQNPKLLLDDYVKFIRFAQWRIEKTGHGILGFITNHSYLDNPTFRGMRQHLMRSFDEIYVLDLHGNSMKKEHTPEGGKDENVFDIQQGVAILLAVKHAGQTSEVSKTSEVYHASLWGLRDEKYAFLQASDVAQVAWTELQPEKPFYLFIPQNVNTLAEYKQGWKVTEIFVINSTGIKTHRDHFVLDFDQSLLKRRIHQFRDLSLSDADIIRTYELPDTRDWKLTERRRSLAKIEDWQKPFNKCLYRPFDIRSIYFHPDVIELPRQEVMRNLLENNLCLIANRQVRLPEVQHFLVSDTLVEFHVLETANAAMVVMPLYLYTTPEETTGTLFAQSETTRKANLAPAFVKAMEEKLGMKFVEDCGDVTVTSQVTVTSPTSFTPEDVFHYAYAVFHSPTYRQRYAEFLKIDFPRLPLTSDKKLFAKLVAKGAELVALHLLKSPKVDDFITTYPVAGSNAVEKVQFSPLLPGEGPGVRFGHVWINPSQYFGGVPEEVCEFKVGGYQVCEKWLKDRKGRVLSGEDIRHYQRVVVALKETLRLMKEIDQTIPKWPLE